MTGVDLEFVHVHSQENSMHETYRIIGWAALLAGVSFLGQPLVVALGPAVFGTSEVVTDPAVLRNAPNRSLSRPKEV
jgi:hypothetical protein